MIFQIKNLFILMISTFSLSALCEFSYLSRSPEALLMGDAYTSLSDDSNTLFYNPAALNRHKGFSLSALNPTLGAPNFIGSNLSLENPFEDLPDTPSGITDKVIGVPLYAQAGISPTLKMQNFAFSLFALSKTKLVLENAIHPQLDINYRYDRGFIMGYAFSLGPSKKSGTSQSFGISVKHIKREGLEDVIDLFSPELIEQSENFDDYKKLRESLGYTRGSTWGLDLGYEFNYKRGSSRIATGISLLSIGGLSFKRESGTKDIPKQEMALNLGVSYSKRLGVFGYDLAFDLHNLLDPLESLGSKVHLGSRLQTPLIDLYLGLNGGYFSYGLGVDLWPVRLLLGFYGVEIGGGYQQRESERIMLSINILDLKAKL